MSDANLFDVLPDVKRAFADAAMALDNLATLRFRGVDATSPIYTAHVKACEQALRKAAEAAESLIPHTTALPDYEVSPRCMADLALDIAMKLDVESWHDLARHKREVGEKGWIQAIEKWGVEMGVGEEDQ